MTARTSDGRSFDVDVAIVGGGIGGLWLLNQLCNHGYNAVLLEKYALGNQQSINSQGIIHGGTKYSLAGTPTSASEAIAPMPDRWRRCLRGEGDVDLRGAKVLSEELYLWSTHTTMSRLVTFLAAQVMRSHVASVPESSRHLAFQNSAFEGNVCRLDEMVLDVPSVVRTLAHNCTGRIYKITDLNFSRHMNGRVESIQFSNDHGNAATLRPRRVVLSAGAGNEALLQQLHCRKPEMQLRPLHQVLLKHDYPHALYAHCIGFNPSPRITISSHPTTDGKWVWYLGGDLATGGVTLSESELIVKGKQELFELLPWLPFECAQWATLRIDRAEPKQSKLMKPDKAFAAVADRCTNVIAAWPTKLTLAPNMADEVEALLDIQPQAPALPAASAQILAPGVATPCWETLFA